MGALHQLPGAKWVEKDLAAVDLRDFGWVDNKQPLITLYVGPRGPQQKMVALLADAATGVSRMSMECKSSEASVHRGVAQVGQRSSD